MTPKEVHKLIKIINREKVFDGYLHLGWKNLSSLESYNLSDVIINDSFWCSNNKLTSLKDSPKKINGSFWCNDNKLTSLKGSPKQVGGNFCCHSNNLTSLEGLPETIDGYIWIEKEVLKRLYWTNPLVGLYLMKNKFYFV